MFGRKKQHVPQKQIDSLIGASTTIEGDIDFVGGLRVDGRVKGHIHSSNTGPSTLVISEKAIVDGEIRVSHVVVDGSVNGPIYASEYLELLPNARVTGDVSYRTFGDAGRCRGRWSPATRAPGNRRRGGIKTHRR